ncbi:MAG: hypothetical protein WD072_07895 [Pirellulales bacterium]
MAVATATRRSGEASHVIGTEVSPKAAPPARRDHDGPSGTVPQITIKAG